MRRAVFFDKDGVLNRDIGLIENLTKFELLPYAVETVKYINEKGFLVFVITNQPVVARGLVTEKELQSHLKTYREYFLSRGAFIQKIYYCPHHPNADIVTFRVNCDCRKPKSGMLEAAKKEFSINLSESLLIGDRISDIIAGNQVNCTTIQFIGDKSDTPLIETDLVISNGEDVPDYKITSLDDIKNFLPN